MSTNALPKVVNYIVSFILYVSLVICLLAIIVPIVVIISTPEKITVMGKMYINNFNGWAPLSFSYQYIHPAVSHFDKQVPFLKYIWVFLLNPMILSAWLLMVYSLRALLVNIRNGKYFDLANASFVRKIGLCSVFIALAYFLQWGFLIMGLITLALGEVFRFGAVLKEENSLTI